MTSHFTLDTAALWPCSMHPMLQDVSGSFALPDKGHGIAFAIFIALLAACSAGGLAVQCAFRLDAWD